MDVILAAFRLLGHTHRSTLDFENACYEIPELNIHGLRPFLKLNHCMSEIKMLAV
jgi:hypothetical protein